MMKRFTAALLLVAALMMLATACGGGQTIGTCELCGEEHVAVQEVSAMGVSGQFCEKCYDTTKTYAELASANA